MYDTNSIKQNFNIHTFELNKIISNKLIIVFSLKLKKIIFNNQEINRINLIDTRLKDINVMPMREVSFVQSICY